MKEKLGELERYLVIKRSILEKKIDDGRMLPTERYRTAVEHEVYCDILKVLRN